MAGGSRVLVEARFDEKLKTYLMLQGVLGFVASIIGIVALPFWVVLGTVWVRRYFEHLSCTLTDRALLVKKGVWFRSETTVPLDRIQDVSIRHGPVLDRLGLATIKVETAGVSGGQSSGINLTGVVGTAAFRDRVLEARDRAAGFADEDDAGDGGAAERGAAAVAASAPPAAPVRAGAADPVATDGLEVLREIRDSLRRIEGLVEGTRAS